MQLITLIMILMLTKNDIINNQTLTFFSKGYANNLYLFKKSGEIFVYRKSKLNLANVYIFAKLFEKYAGTKYNVIDNHSIFYKYIPGTSLNDLVKTIDYKKEKQIFNQLGNIFSKIHTIQKKYFLYRGVKYDSWPDIIYKKIKESKTDTSKDLLDFFKRKFDKHLKRKSFEKRLCHGDFSLRNIIYNDNLFIIDWDKFFVGDVYFELSNILSRLFNNSRSCSEYDLRKDCFFKGYSRFTKKEIEIFLTSKEYKIYSLFFTIEFFNHWNKLGVSDKAKLFENRANFLINWMDSLD